MPLTARRLSKRSILLFASLFVCALIYIACGGGGGGSGPINDNNSDANGIEGKWMLNTHSGIYPIVITKNGIELDENLTITNEISIEGDTTGDSVSISVFRRDIELDIHGNYEFETYNYDLPPAVNVNKISGAVVYSSGERQAFVAYPLNVYDDRSKARIKLVNWSIRDNYLELHIKNDSETTAYLPTIFAEFLDGEYFSYTRRSINWFTDHQGLYPGEEETVIFQPISDLSKATIVFIEFKWYENKNDDYDRSNLENYNDQFLYHTYVINNLDFEVDLVGVWDISEYSDNEAYLHLYNNGDYTIETNSYPDENGNLKEGFFYFYGIYSYQNDNLILFPDNAQGRCNGVIPVEQIDNCWFFSLFYNEIELKGLYQTKNIPSRLCIESSGEVIFDPTRPGDCPDELFTSSSVITWAEKYSDDPEKMVLIPDGGGVGGCADDGADF